MLPNSAGSKSKLKSSKKGGSGSKKNGKKKKKRDRSIQPHTWWDIDEIVVHCLSFLSARDLARVALVNQKLCHITQDPTLWKQLCIRVSFCKFSVSDSRY